jgi:hypothetical protein
MEKIVVIQKKNQDVSLIAWLAKPGRTRAIVFDERPFVVIGDKSKQPMFYAFLREAGMTVSVGLGPSKLSAQKDAWVNLPKKRKCS